MPNDIRWGSKVRSRPVAHLEDLTEPPCSRCDSRATVQLVYEDGTRSSIYCEHHGYTALAAADKKATKANPPQTVEVDVGGGRLLAYQWRGLEKLKVGDRVELPPNELSAVIHGPGLFTGTVAALGTDYGGRMSFIRRRLD